MTSLRNSESALTCTQTMSLLKRYFLLFLCVCVTTVGAAWREPVRMSHGMVASTERIASQIGVDVMKRGGNAVDAAVAVALRKYGSGKLTWSELIEPARRLAVDGFVVTHRTEKGLENNQTILSPFADSRRIFLREGKLYREGETLRQPELADTLGRLHF